ncbi:alpha/beta fold hydrolase [Streptomyces sp. NPDC058373]|uniref:alpha/beta fold hydrolase n=1 Tax=Streptomyces sp. NPDC058373 TaxID=3346465 RepID=UPI00365B9787
MPTFTAPDGTQLAYHPAGEGPPLVCLPGGPLHPAAYLGDLGGLTAHRRLIGLDLRGSGASQVPADPASYRCDRLVADVEALRRHLGVDRVDLLGHSAGANLAARYAERHPERVDRLVLCTPSTFAVGMDVPGPVRAETARLRQDEPWFPEAYAALEDVAAGRATAASWEAMAPFMYARWSDEARAHRALGDGLRGTEAAAAYGAEGAFDPPATRAALAAFDRPVLLVAGELDLNSPPAAVTEYTALFPDARLTVLPGVSHFPWVDDPRGFASAVAGFLA